MTRPPSPGPSMSESVAEYWKQSIKDRYMPSGYLFIAICIITCEFHQHLGSPPHPSNISTSTLRSSDVASVAALPSIYPSCETPCVQLRHESRDLNVQRVASWGGIEKLEAQDIHHGLDSVSVPYINFVHVTHSYPL